MLWGFFLFSRKMGRLVFKVGGEFFIVVVYIRGVGRNVGRFLFIGVFWF